MCLTEGMLIYCKRHALYNWLDILLHELLHKCRMTAAQILHDCIYVCGGSGSPDSSEDSDFMNHHQTFAWMGFASQSSQNCSSPCC